MIIEQKVKLVIDDSLVWQYNTCPVAILATHQVVAPTSFICSVTQTSKNLQLYSSSASARQTPKNYSTQPIQQSLNINSVGK